MPTSQEFRLVEISTIRVLPNRFRAKFSDIEGMEKSLKQIGLLHPIIIRRDGTLVAGERRLRAAKALGWDHIPAQYLDDLSSAEARLVELEENIRRQDLTWQEDCRAHLEFHRGQQSLHDNLWSMVDSAELIGCGERAFQRRIEIALELEHVNEAIKDCDSLGAAYTVLVRERERAREEEIETLNITVDDVAAGVGKEREVRVDETGKVVIPPPPWERNPVRSALDDVFCADFREWATEYDGEPFNFLHVDFPYGVSYHKSEQGGTDKWDMYDDSEKVYWELLDVLVTNVNRLTKNNCHLMFWFSMNHYISTVQTLREADFDVNPRPLVWAKSDNVGIIPDALRGPRNTYETALLCSRGDRKIVGPVADAVWYPGSRKEARHPSEKPWGMLSHFFRMLVDKNTSMLDPTCGSGNALALAWRLGARRVCGIDLSERCIEQSRHSLNQMRMIMAGETSKEAEALIKKAYKIVEGIDDIVLDI